MASLRKREDVSQEVKVDTQQRTTAQHINTNEAVFFFLTSMFIFESYDIASFKNAACMNLKISACETSRRFEDFGESSFGDFLKRRNGIFY